MPSKPLRLSASHLPPPYLLPPRTPIPNSQATSEDFTPRGVRANDPALAPQNAPPLVPQGA